MRRPRTEGGRRFPSSWVYGQRGRVAGRRFGPWATGAMHPDRTQRRDRSLRRRPLPRVWIWRSRRPTRRCSFCPLASAPAPSRWPQDGRCVRPPRRQGRSRPRLGRQRRLRRGESPNRLELQAVLHSRADYRADLHTTKSASISSRHTLTSISPLVYVPSARRSFPNSSRIMVSSEFSTTFTTSCGGMKTTPVGVPRTTSPGSTAAAPIAIGMLMPASVTSAIAVG